MRFQLFDSQRCCLHRRRSQRLEKNIRQPLIDSKTTHVEAFTAMPRVESLTLPVVAGRGIRALISDTQPPAAVPTDGQALQQCGSFSQGVTWLVESLFLGQMTNSFSDRALLIDVSLVTRLTVNIGPSIHRIAEHAVDGGVTRDDPLELMAISQARHHAARMHGEGQFVRAEPQPNLAC